MPSDSGTNLQEIIIQRLLCSRPLRGDWVE